jgi:hypothetical protein
MENNIFVRNKKEKFNPDVDSKLQEKENERTNTKFEMSNTIYNPIIGKVPDKISNSKDLLLNIDTSKKNIKELIQEKENERLKQDEIYKPVKNKVTNQPVQNYNNNEFISQNTFNDLKKNTIQKVENKNNDILNNLKSLGILK